MFVFLSLHAVGAHYTCAEVPYDEWDSQKDSALMIPGALVAIALARRLSDSPGTGILRGTGGLGDG